jgi:1,4-alpha-glucan branching enzyme
MNELSPEAYAIVEGRHSDPFHYLGLHNEGGQNVVRAFLPEATNVEAVGEHGEATSLARIHEAGLFAGPLPNGSKRYQLRARFGDNVVELEDPYRFPPVLSEYDLYLLAEGTHQRLYDKLGAHPMTLEGIDGVAFVVLAPNAQRVSVVGDFNFWNPRRHPMRVRGVGYWELFVPRATPGDHYKFDIVGRAGQHLPLKADPFAFATEMRPGTASIVFDERRLPHPRGAPERVNALNSPMSVYEVHLGSWRRKGNNEWLTYQSTNTRLTAHGATNRPGCTRRRAGSVRRRISRRWSTPAIAKASACCWIGFPGISRTIRTASVISMAPRSTSTPIRFKDGISTGVR